MQLDPGYPVVPRGFHSRPRDCFHRWNPTYDNPLPNFACFAFNCNLRPYSKDPDVKVLLLHAGTAAAGLTLTQAGAPSSCHNIHHVVIWFEDHTMIRGMVTITK